MKKLMMVFVLGVSSQGFASANLNDAFANALKSSDADHKNQQIVLNVSPNQIEKATFKRDNTTHVVSVEDNMMTDMTKSAIDEQPTKRPGTNEDLARLKSELNDI